MKTIKQLTQNKFLNIKEITDLKNNVKGYQFAERKGVDSVAFIIYDKNTNKYLINREYSPPVSDFHYRAFGGSLDKNIEKWQIVQAEVKEEAGYVVSKYEINLVGKVFVSTQMNQYCYLYLVKIDTDKLEQQEREPENEVEAMAQPVWKTEDEIIEDMDWKAIVIIQKARMQKLL